MTDWTKNGRVLAARAASIERNLHGSTCMDCITTDNPDQPCNCMCATCVNAQRTASAAVRAAISERAESYASDARKFSDMPKLGQCADVNAERYVSEEDCKRYAAMYRAIADELRKVAASL